MYYLVSLDARYWRKNERHVCAIVAHLFGTPIDGSALDAYRIEVFYVCFQVKLKEEEEEDPKSRSKEGKGREWNTRKLQVGEKIQRNSAEIPKNLKL